MPPGDVELEVVAPGGPVLGLVGRSSSWVNPSTGDGSRADAREAVDGVRALMAGPVILGCMAICQLCEREMLTAASCSVSALHIAGKPFPVVPYGAETRYGRIVSTLRRCHDCGVEPQGFHHLGCDWAECPQCRGQLLSCTCPFDEFADDSDDSDDEDLEDEV